MIYKSNDRECAIVFNGEIYNMLELKKELEDKGTSFDTTSDTEVILKGYMIYGRDFIKKLNGIFAIALWDSAIQTSSSIRDRLGVKLCFTQSKGTHSSFHPKLKGFLLILECIPCWTMTDYVKFSPWVRLKPMEKACLKISGKRFRRSLSYHLQKHHKNQCLLEIE